MNRLQGEGPKLFGFTTYIFLLWFKKEKKNLWKQAFDFLGVERSRGMFGQRQVSITRRNYKVSLMIHKIWSERAGASHVRSFSKQLRSQ
jgi:hypothetical protein